MPISPVINSYTPYFGNKQPKKAAEEQKYKNPIKPGFEYVDAVKATMGAALIFLGKIAYEFCTFGDIDDVTGALSKVQKKTKNKYLGIELLAVGAVLTAGAYFLTHLPKNLYEKKKEIFVKKKEWDIYSRTNSAEKSIYERIAKEAKTVDPAKKQELARDFLKMKATQGANINLVSM
jgi:hypothetical protein